MYTQELISSFRHEGIKTHERIILSKFYLQSILFKIDNYLSQCGEDIFDISIRGYVSLCVDDGFDKFSRNYFINCL